MQRASSETLVLDAERSFEPAISRLQLSALPAELWLPVVAGYNARHIGHCRVANFDRVPVEMLVEIRSFREVLVDQCQELFSHISFH